MKSLAIIPARSGSKGLKDKNVRELNGKHLIGYTIEAALESKSFDKVIVSTDDERIASVAEKYGAEIPFLRPKELASDTAKSIDVVTHAISSIEAEFGCTLEDITLLQPTSPLRNERHIREAMKLFKSNNGTPIVSVCLSEQHPELLKVIKDGHLTSYLGRESIISRRQDLSLVYSLNGAIYISSRDFILENEALYGERVIPYIMDKKSSVDIDDIVDFILAETLIKNGVD